MSRCANCIVLPKIPDSYSSLFLLFIVRGALEHILSMHWVEGKETPWRGFLSIKSAVHFEPWGKMQSPHRRVWKLNSSAAFTSISAAMGFLNTNTARQLREEHRVLCLRRRREDWTEAEMMSFLPSQVFDSLISAITGHTSQICTHNVVHMRYN